MDSDFSFEYPLHSQHEYLEENTMGNEMEEIEALQGQQYVDYGDETMAVQMQSTSRNPLRWARIEQLASVSNFEFQPSSTPSPNPFSRADSCSVRIVSERKQYESSSNSRPQQLQPESQSPNFYCEVCQVPCSSSLNYKNHLDGKKHKVKLQEVGFARKDDGDDCKTKNPKFWCETCNIWCVDDNSLKQHLAGKKHKKMLEKLETIEGDICEELMCELCGIGCRSKELLQLHLNGKKHQAEVRKLEQAETSRPKKCKLYSAWCLDGFFADSSRGEETFRDRVEAKKRKWQDLIRDI